MNAVFVRVLWPQFGSLLRAMLVGLLVCVGQGATSAWAAITYNVSFDDPGGVYASYYPLLTSNTLAAGAEWSSRLSSTSNVSLEVQISFGSNPTANGGSSTSNFVRNNGTYNVFAQGAAAEIRTGIDPNGASPDIGFTIGSNYLANELFLSPDPFNPLVTVPSDRTDAVSVLMHEFGHAFGFNGWRDPTNFSLPGDYQSTYDEQQTFDGTYPYFTGAAATALYGGPVPLTAGNSSHLGNYLPGPGSSIDGDLMGGFFFRRGYRNSISPLDLALLGDIGVPLAPPKNWIGPVALPGSWSNPAYWSAAGVPGNGATVNIAFSGAPRTVVYDYTGPAVTLTSLTLADQSGAFEPTLLMSGGSLLATAEYLGKSGVGIFLQSGGTNTVGTGGLYLGFGPTGYGEYDLSGGTATANGNVYVGGASDGTGVLTVSGNGVLTVIGELIGNNTATSTINLNGGTINAATLNFNSSPAILNWSAGTLNITTNVTFDSAAAATSTSAALGASRTLGSGQTLKVTGNETLGGIGAFGLTVNSGGTNTVVGDMSVNSLGSLSVNSGGLVTTQNVMYIGDDSATTAHVVASGANAAIQVGDWIHLGNGGRGDMTVSGGAFVSIIKSLQVGAYGGSIGELTVSGADSSVQSVWYTNVGWGGQGTVTVASGGTVSTAGDFNLAVGTTAQGTVNINNGGTVTASGDSHVGGGGWQNAVGGTGVMYVNTGGTLNVAGVLEIVSSAANKVNLAGGTINTGSLNYNGNPSLLNWTSGTLKINNSATFDSAAVGTTTSAAFGPSLTLGSGKTLRVSNSLTLGGAGAFGLTVGSGGKVEATAVTVAALGQLGGTGTVQANVQNGGLVTPGNSPGALHITGNFTQTAAGELSMELASGTSYDSLEVTGQMALAGKLTVTLGFVPVGGEVFDILDFSSVTTTFNTMILPTLNSTMLWNTSRLYTTGELSISLPGDYNINGQVDAGDYVVWRKMGGTPTQYDAWRSHFGAGSAGAGTSNFQVTVPEPSAMAMAVMGLVAMLGRRSYRREVDTRR